MIGVGFPGQPDSGGDMAVPADGTFRNPVLPGFHPDPSICRVGADYWMVCSSFACFPGVPVFHSRDLVHWRQAGNALDRPSQLDLDGVGHSEGIFAPTIRYHQGTYYLITTLVANGRPNRPRGNFVVTAHNPAGPWSDPIWLPDAPGIDPSLFFDADGSLWFCGTRERAGAAYFGDWEIYVQPMDPATLALQGEPTAIWRGALRDCVWPEGPHLYRKDGWYYLLHAEGGTDRQHAVCVARGRALAGPWEGNPANPVLTHRHLGRGCDIVNTGHGDLVETQAGEWWMVVLASRPQMGYRNLGRETFLVPLDWEDGWPVFCRGAGRIPMVDRVPALPQAPLRLPPACDHFDEPVLAPGWLTLRTPRDDFYSLGERPGHLRLYLRPATLDAPVQPGFLGRRQLHHDWQALASLDFTPLEPEDCAGLALVQSDAWHYRLEKGCAAVGMVDEVRLVRVAGGKADVLASQPTEGGRIVLGAAARDQRLRFWFRDGRGHDCLVAEGVDGTLLSTERAGGFVGSLIGLFAQGRDQWADFDWFEYQAGT